jgi:hypothetical protein
MFNRLVCAGEQPWPIAMFDLWQYQRGGLANAWMINE